MYRHLGLHRIPMPASPTGRGGSSTSHATPAESSAIGFASAVVLTVNTMVMGAALIVTAPLTVTVPIATALVSGLIASTVVVTGTRWLASRHRTERHRP